MADVRNLYQDDVDFAVLAWQSPPFKKHLKPNGQLDFTDPKAVQYALVPHAARSEVRPLNPEKGNSQKVCSNGIFTSTLNCPTIDCARRFNYIVWIQDLLDTTSDRFTDCYDPDREVTGLDIGTGSCCIYPLLGCSLRPQWKFIATDIDEKNVRYATENVLRNNLQSRIHAYLTKPTDPLIPLEVLGIDAIDFTICNPPFYASPSELLTCASVKSRPPHSACTGATIEMITPGGEVAFVTRIIEESLVLKNRCQWYTSMVGMLSSLYTLLNHLKKARVRNWAVQEFVQGTKTRRWAIAWSFRDLRPRRDIARGMLSFPRNLLPFPSDYNFTTPTQSPDKTKRHLKTILDKLDLECHYDTSASTVTGFAPRNVWSRSARRQRKPLDNRDAPPAADVMRNRNSKYADAAVADEADTYPSGDETREPALGFRIEAGDGEEAGSADVRIRWLRGHDSVLFESFCGMVKRQLGENVEGG